MTKPLFAIPTHQFLFNAGNIEPKAYIDTLQLEMSEFSLIRYPERGPCLYRCGNERYLLQVHAPVYKEKLFGRQGKMSVTVAAAAKKLLSTLPRISGHGKWLVRLSVLQSPLCYCLSCFCWQWKSVVICGNPEHRLF